MFIQRARANEVVGEALRGRRDDIIAAAKSQVSVQDGRLRYPGRGSTAPDLVAATLCVPARTVCRVWAPTG